jgi:tRNA dimethylallyltransferase
MRLPLLVIAGPTGVGKTAAAVALGSRVPIEVVSADSRQVYRFMDTATGKPTAEERATRTTGTRRPGSGAMPRP